MKRIMMMVSFLLLLSIMSGCSSSSNWELTMPSDYMYKKNIPLMIQVNENNKPIQGLEIKAVLEMEKMDHGEVEVLFQDQGNGQYVGEAALPMGGVWIAFIELSDGNHIIEQTQTLNIKEQ